MDKGVQSVIFKKYGVNGKRTGWNKVNSKQWLIKHGMKHNKIDETESSYRYRQFPPAKNKKFISKRLKNSVTLVIMVDSR